MSFCRTIKCKLPGRTQRQAGRQGGDAAPGGRAVHEDAGRGAAPTPRPVVYRHPTARSEEPTDEPLSHVLSKGRHEGGQEQTDGANQPPPAVDPPPAAEATTPTP